MATFNCVFGCKGWRFAIAESHMRRHGIESLRQDGNLYATKDGCLLFLHCPQHAQGMPQRGKFEAVIEDGHFVRKDRHSGESVPILTDSPLPLLEIVQLLPPASVRSAMRHADRSGGSG